MAGTSAGAKKGWASRRSGSVRGGGVRLRAAFGAKMLRRRGVSNRKVHAFIRRSLPKGLVHYKRFSSG